MYIDFVNWLGNLEQVNKFNQVITLNEAKIINVSCSGLIQPIK